MSGPALRVARIGLNTVDPETLARFFVDALGFDRVDATTVRLGDVPIDLHRVDASAAAYPSEVPGWSPLFQHFAIVVPDMTTAMQRLATSTQWTPISIDGPQTLPTGVVAFKFRDAEGHPLELLVLHDVSTPRIDHSAISVADVARSIAFYAALGFHVGPRTLNHGIAQQRLDDIVDATVDVVGMLPSAVETPHVELLGYRGAYDRVDAPASIDAIASTRLVLAVTDQDALQDIVARDDGHTLLRDPDGHLLELVIESRPHS